MDIPQVLNVLRPGEDWGPNSGSDSTYEELASTWRSEKNFCPTLEQMQQTWTSIEANRPFVEARKLIQDATQALFTGVTPTQIATRATVVAVCTRINDVAEGLYALVDILYSRINQRLPTPEELSARIVELRLAGYDPVMPAPGTVATDSIRRLQHPELVSLIISILLQGGGNPTH